MVYTVGNLKQKHNIRVC